MLALLLSILYFFRKLETRHVKTKTAWSPTRTQAENESPGKQVEMFESKGRGRGK
jgi:hypothetical protein